MLIVIARHQQDDSVTQTSQQCHSVMYVCILAVLTSQQDDSCETGNKTIWSRKYESSQY